MIRIPTNRSPIHPGEILLEEFLNPMGLTQRQLADGIHVPYQRINDIVNGCQRITAKFAKMSGMGSLNISFRSEGSRSYRRIN